MIIINKPYLKKGDITTRLCCDIILDGKDYNLWYEVNNEFANYLCFEKAYLFHH